MSYSKIYQKRKISTVEPKSIRGLLDLAEVDSPIITYRTAQLKHNKSGYHIEYYALNNGKLERCRIRLNIARRRCESYDAFKGYAEEICFRLNKMLALGWSPFEKGSHIIQGLTVQDVATRYLSEKGKELRKATMRSYASFCSMLVQWCERNMQDPLIDDFDKVMAVRYLDYIYNEKDVSVHTYNNTMKMGKAFFAYATEKCYVTDNPFESLKTKRGEGKTRVLIPKSTRNAITTYLSGENRGFLLVCQLVFGALMRPKEVRMVQVKHIDLDRKCIVVPAENAKNHHLRYAPLSNEVIAMIEELGIGHLPNEVYLVGRQWKPSFQMLSEAAMTKEWVKVRKVLRLPTEMQLYSLRDTGINEMLKAGIDSLSVMQAADHHDLSMTTRYANHADEHLIDKIRVKAPKF